MQVTKGGGYGTVGTTDGFIYYTRSSGTEAVSRSEFGVWKIPVDAGEETKVFDEAGVSGSVHPLNLWVTADGVYFSNRTATPGPAIEFYRFATKETTKLLAIDRSKFYGTVTASPDGKWILWPQIDQLDNDIMLVENFQ